MWDHTFSLDGNNFALTFQPNNTFKGCNYGQLHNSHQGIPFQILQTENLNADIINICNGHSWQTKQEIHTNIGKTDRYKFDIQIVNVSTAEVVKGVLHPVFRYPIHKPLQIYLLSSTFYGTNGAIIDRSSIIPSQVQLWTHTLKLVFATNGDMALFLTKWHTCLI